MLAHLKEKGVIEEVKLISVKVTGMGGGSSVVEVEERSSVVDLKARQLRNQLQSQHSAPGCV